MDPNNAPNVVLSKTTFWQNKKAVFWSMWMMSIAFEFGFDFGTIGGFQAMEGFLQVFGEPDPSSAIGWNISPTVQQLISSLMTLGGFVGNIALGFIGRYLGRRHALMASCALMILAIGLMFTPSIGVLYFARTLLGFSIGLVGGYAQLWVLESMPFHLRGSMISFFTLWISIGGVISVVINATGNRAGRSCYQIPLGICFVIPTLLIITLPFIPESPRWLVAQERYADAEKALRRIRPKFISDTVIQQEVADIREARDAEMELSKGVAIKDLITGTNRRRTLISVAAGVLQSATGCSFILSYGVYFFLFAGSTKPFQDSMIVNCVGILGVILSMYTMRVFPRRPILMIAFTALALSMFSMALAYTISPQSGPSAKCVVGFTVIFVFFYNWGVSPYTFLLSGEVPSQRLRAYTMGASGAFSYLASWTVSYTAPYFINSLDLNWGPKYGWIWLASNLICVVFTYFCIPETKGRSLEDLDELFEQRISARKFAKYICVGPQTALHEHGKGDVAVETVEVERVDA